MPCDNGGISRTTVIVAAVGSALPPNRYDQDALRAFLEAVWADHPRVRSRLAGLHRNARVRTRHLALPLEAYGDLDTFGKANDAWIAAASELGEGAVRDALDRAGIAAGAVDALFTVSVTGIASPSLDARLINRMGLRPDLVRVPIFGLGCVAGVAGLARAVDHVRAYPDRIAVLLAVELCSLTFQRGDLSVANLVASALFADGAAAVVVVGAERARREGIPGPEVLATRSVFYPDTEDVMGWRISERGFRIVLSPGVPALARERLGADVDAFLADHGLARAAIGSWLCHPGGPKVLAAVRDALDLDDRDVATAWQVLAEQGNLSSASVLMVLRETLEGARPAPGTKGVMVAMGPGFCSELALLAW